MSYADIDFRMRRAAARLREAGVTPGEVVAIKLKDSVEYTVVLLALARVGALSTGLAYTMPPTEVAEEMAFVGARRLVHDERHRPRDSEGPIPLARVLDPSPEGDDREHLPSSGPSPGMMLVSTSGTTGTPKNLILNHQQMLWRTETTRRLFGPHPDDRVLLVPGLQTAWGRRGFFFDLIAGATAVINSAATGADMVALLRRERITFMLAAPSHLRAMMRAARGEAPMLPDLRVVVSSATLSPAERRLMRRWITPRLHFAYGTNEVGYVSVASPEDQDRFPHTVGRVIDGVHLSIVDPDGREVPAGTVGEVRIQAPETPARYEGDPDTTGRYFRDGWFHPGDLGVLDAEGYLVLKGRTDDVINSSGLKFYPSEVEEVLAACRGVTEVAVLPWPDPRTGEAPLAVIVPGTGYDKDELLVFCQRRMPASRIPVHFLTMPSLPKNAMGKVQKAVLKTLVARALPVVPSRPGEDAPP